MPAIARCLLPLTVLGLSALPAPGQEIFSEADFDQNARQVVGRDEFPVLNYPEMAAASKGDEALREDEPVLGVVAGGEARAYPISVMGRHELCNDRCGGVPIAPSW